MITVADIMTIDPVVVGPDTSLEEVIGLMKTNHFRHLPVTESGRLVGIVSDRDVRLAMNSPMVTNKQLDDMALLKNTTAGASMTPSPMVVGPTDPATQAARLMQTYKFSALPVVEDDKLVGIVTVSDILSNYITVLEAQAQTRLS